MSNRNTNEAVSTGDSLGLGAENPRVRLRSNQNLSRRSEGIIFGDDFQVTADQEEADKDLVKQVYHGRFDTFDNFFNLEIKSRKL